MPDGVLGGEDGANWTWEQALNAFHGDNPSLEVKKVEVRDTVMSVKWLLPDHWRQPRAGGKEPPTDFKVYTETNATTFWGVANVNYEGMAEPMKGFYANARLVLDSLLGNYNPVAQPNTFYMTASALIGATNLINDQAATLTAWRDKVGHKGDELQGGGATAFWNALDLMVFTRQDIVRQMGAGTGSGSHGPAWDAINEARGSGQDDLKTVGVLEGKAGLEWAINKLADGYRQWMSTTESFTYDTETRFGEVFATGSSFAWPAAALNTMWTHPRFHASFRSVSPTQAFNEVKDWFPYSMMLEAGVNQGAFWDEIEKAAKNVWQKHLQHTLDVHAQDVIVQLTKSYRASAEHLPTIIAPRRLNLTTPPNTNTTNPPNLNNTNPPDLNKTDPPKLDLGGSGPNLPPTGPPNLGGPNNGNGRLGPIGPGNPNLTLPGVTDPGSLLKVPTGSRIDPDGTVRGPDGKPLLDPLGRPVVVPPGSRINPDGEIVGPGGAKLTERDRLFRPDPTKTPVRQDSELDRYLNSLRGGAAPSLPTLLPGVDLRPGSLADASGKSFGIGANSPVTSFGSNGTPDSGKQLGSAVTPMARPATEGGPSLLKSQQGGAAGQNGMGGVPFYPPMAGGMGAGQEQNKGERDRATWLAEDEETWGTDPKLPPSVLGARRRRGRVGTQSGPGSRNNHGQGGGDGQLAGGTTAPGHGYVDGSA